MKASVKERWIENLTSGKYQQSKGSLKNDKGYCCLGVLIESVDGAQIYEPEGRISIAIYKGFNMENQTFGYIPENLAKEIGLNVDTQHMLTEMNDKDGYTFKDIARYIEDNL